MSGIGSVFSWKWVLILNGNLWSHNLIWLWALRILFKVYHFWIYKHDNIDLKTWLRWINVCVRFNANLTILSMPRALSCRTARLRSVRCSSGGVFSGRARKSSSLRKEKRFKIDKFLVYKHTPCNMTSQQRLFVEASRWFFTLITWCLIEVKLPMPVCLLVGKSAGRHNFLKTSILLSEHLFFCVGWPA